MEENHFKGFSTTEWRDIRDYIQHCLGICLSDRKTLDLVNQLVTKIDQCLSEAVPQESSWEEVGLFNNKEVEWEIDL